MMTKKMFVVFSFMLVLFSCNQHKPERPSTAIETGSTFIKASLIGDFNTAETLLVKDSENIALFNAYKQFYDRMPVDKKQHYKEASYEINKLNEANDSTVLINYANDYMNKPMEIKVVRNNAIWSIDFKYTYSGNLPID